ncbi:MAG: 3',5'-cyclic-nucleotide phosphodiesterase [Myxococcota bacterium]|nr:3',5'-cyclic-nucleotide phosphodiesterase [Myxococcota bacterium]MDW8364150.1 3',5'-cyclic-nucleotide phosphodiesterase [Myxococcales bacterium]
MELRVLGCHGGETPRHRSSAFLVDGRLAIDAGAITSELSLDEQRRIEAVAVSHAHLDHVRDLASLADNRCQQGGPTLTVAGTPGTLRALRRHFFNDRLWPDFSRIPTPRGPTIRWLPLRPERAASVAGFELTAVLVTHTIESAGFVVRASDGGALAYSGDTGPTERFWQVLGAQRDLRALLMEVSFPDEQARLARVSGHHTPSSLRAELRKLRAPRDLPILLYHIKPVFQARVERQLRALRGRNLSVLRLGDRFLL